MSDVDYQRLFENGQLVWTVPDHKLVLDRFYQAFKGFPEENILRTKYKDYMDNVHPEGMDDLLAVKLSPVGVQVLPEDLVLPHPEANVSEPMVPVAAAPKRRGRPPSNKSL